MVRVHVLRDASLDINLFLEKSGDAIHEWTGAIRAPMLVAATPQFILSLVAAFSSGGGNGLDENGIPFQQSCDAIYLCDPACPPGMTAVAPPVRSSLSMSSACRMGATCTRRVS